MSNSIPSVPKFELDDELVQKISGGASCSASEVTQLLDQLKENYDTLVDFTSYVIERVITSSTN